MAAILRRCMNALFWACMAVSGVCLVLVSVVIPWGVFMRYVVNSAESWPEPLAILFTVVLTFLGAAACYRIGAHMKVEVVPNSLPPKGRRVLVAVDDVAVGVLALFMTVWGIRLCEATWHQVIPDFPFLVVGITYLPIPVGGAALFLFVIERMLIGPPPKEDVELGTSSNTGH